MGKCNAKVSDLCWAKIESNSNCVDGEGLIKVSKGGAGNRNYEVKKTRPKWKGKCTGE